MHIVSNLIKIDNLDDADSLKTDEDTDIAGDPQDTESTS